MAKVPGLGYHFRMPLQPYDGKQSTGTADDIAAGIAERQAQLFPDHLGVSAIKGIAPGALSVQSMDLSGRVYLSAPDALTNGGYTIIMPPDAGTANQRMSIVSIANRELTMEWSLVDHTDLDTDLHDTMEFFVGATLDDPDVNVSSDGATITLSYQKDGGGDMRVVFTDHIHVHDCTPPATLTLTAGTDTAPVRNYIYILQSDKLLTVSTSGWPSTEYAPVAEVLCQSATAVQSHGPLKFQIWTDHTINGAQGHLAHINSWIRSQATTWMTGLEVNVSVGVGTFDISFGAGSALQLHPHDVEAFDTAAGDDVFIVNDSVTAFKKVGDLTGELTDADGNTLSNKFYNLVVWESVCEIAANSKTYINLPSGSYNTEAAAVLDADKTAVYTIPEAFRGVGFTLARLTVKHGTGGGGTFTLAQNEDLRVTIGGGGGAGGAGVTMLPQLSDVDTAALTGSFIMMTPVGGGNYAGRLLVEADLPDTYYKQDDVILANSGSVSFPGLSFSGDTNTGIHNPEADKLGFVANGTEMMYLMRLSGFFDVAAIIVDIFEIDASSSWVCQTPETTFGNSIANPTLPAVVAWREAANNGTNKVLFTIPASIASNVTWTWPVAIVSSGVWFSDGSGVLTCEKILRSKGGFIRRPGTSLDQTLFFTTKAITVTQITGVLRGGTSGTITIRHSPDRSATGIEVVTGGSAITSLTTGTVITSFNDATIPANSWVWMEMPAKTGILLELGWGIDYTDD